MTRWHLGLLFALVHFQCSPLETEAGKECGCWWRREERSTAFVNIGNVSSSPYSHEKVKPRAEEYPRGVEDLGSHSSFYSHKFFDGPQPPPVLHQSSQDCSGDEMRW